MTLSDLEWPFDASRAISAVAELLVDYSGVFVVIVNSTSIILITAAYTHWHGAGLNVRLWFVN